MHGIERAVLRSRAWRLVDHRIVVPAAVGLSPLPADADVLQVGCGGGFETDDLARRFQSWRIVATDIDAEMVELARNRVTAPNVQFQIADATRLQLPDSTFDIVFAALVWHHIPEWRSATWEAGRVLKTGGTAVLVDLAPPTTVAPHLTSVARDYSYPALLATLFRAGFRHYRARRIPLAYALHARG
jgi:ubiquinone/menaquinone biosynthesis C-methylase UbiE